MIKINKTFNIIITLAIIGLTLTVVLTTVGPTRIEQMQQQIDRIKKDQIKRGYEIEALYKDQEQTKIITEDIDKRVSRLGY